MSAFEIVVTPTSVKNARRKIAAREPISVVMAPFSAKSVVTFDDIPVTKVARRFLNIFNPSDQDLTITLTHSIDREFGVTFEWYTTLIPSHNSVAMEIVWSPKNEVGGAKDIIKLTDNRHFVKDVSLVFRSVDPVNRNNKSAKPPVATKTRNTTGKLKMKSPSPPNRLLRQAINSGKLNSTQMTGVTKSVTNSKSSRFDDGPKTPLREQNAFSQHSNVNYNGGKENKSPITPTIVSTKFDQFQFTPVTHHQKIQFTDVGSIDYMASLPTPTVKSTQAYSNPSVNSSNTIQQSNDFEITSFQPEIASTVGKEIVSLPTLQLTELEPRRQLFELNSNPELKCASSDSAESFVDMQVLTVPSKPILNKTHTIVSSSITTAFGNEKICDFNALQTTFKISSQSSLEQLPKSIATECSSNTFQNTFNVSPKPLANLLSIQVSQQIPGSPLRKKFQSMRNLDEMSKKTKMLKENQGSMPNLADIQEMQPIESNRYFYQSATNVQSNDQLNVSIVSTRSFKENDFQAQSSRFNLNESIAVDIPFHGRPFAVPKPVNSNRCKRPMDDGSVQPKALPKTSPPKRSRLDSSSTSINSSSGRKSMKRSPTWGAVKPKKFLYSVPKLNLTRQKREEEEERIVFFDPEQHIKAVINPDAFAATTTYDPFLAATMYLDEECIEKHELNFKKWLNALVAIPWEIDGDQQQPIDFGKLFNDVRGKELNMAETKEVVSSNYLTKHRMESLRKTATGLFTSDDMTKMFQNLCVQIERGQLKIRDSLDINLDIVLQRDTLELLLCFNPLWLRIGLEVIYGEVINMNHNFDVLSLSRFIVNRLFKNKQLEQKYSKKSEQLRKFTLKKLFMLIVFLDKAKQKKIITFNPCLFVKSSPYKETKEILFRFSSLILGNVGDIQRDLKRIGIVFTHKQTQIEEFDYAFRNLAVDLRDGIRLTKVMEIILLRDDMVNRLRVPAISRLQKVFNVDLALQALKDAAYVISGGITAADIADGHREKTLSLLWQIIYKFRAPKFNAAAKTIQLWWRRSWLKVNINRRIRVKIEKARIAAATRIQAAYRGYLSRKLTKILHAKRTSAAVILQSHIRRYIAKRQYRYKLNAAKYIQCWYKRVCLSNRLRNNYLVQRNSVITIQKWYRRIQLAEKIESFVPLIHSIRDEIALQNRYASILQHRYRATCLMRLQREKFLKIRSSVIVIQQRLRSYLLMKKEKAEYLHMRKTIITVQTRFRANLQMKKIHREFCFKKKATLCIQKFFRATTEARRVRNEFLVFKKAAIKIQERYRARLEMLKAVQQFNEMKRSVITIQQRFRALVAMRKEFSSFQIKKHAAIVVQTRYRAVLEMRRQRQTFVQIKYAVQVLQLRWRATLLMRQQRYNYKQIRASTVMMQRRIVANRKMIEERTVFNELKNAVILIQTLYRAKVCMREEKTKYQQLRWACIYVQQRYRANKIAKIQRDSYQRMKHFATCVQRRFRANKLMKSQRLSYLKMRDSVVTIQEMFRGKLKMRRERHWFLNLIRCVIVIQRKYRARKSMEIYFERFKIIKNSVMVLQVRYRAQIQMRHQRHEFLKQKANAIKIQRWIRATKLAREERQKFLTYRQNVCNIQIRYRAKLRMLQIQSHYKSIQWATIFVQRKFRAKQAMNQQRLEFHQLRRSVVAIQRRYRGKCEMKQQILEYQLLKKSTISIQTYFRSYKLMKTQRESFLKLRTACVTIQHRFRSYRLTQIIRQEFVILKRTTIFIQTLRRANVLMRNQESAYVKLRNAAVMLQTRYRANRLMKVQREVYQRQIRAALSIQNYFRATMKMRLERLKYVVLRDAAIVCQRQFRANLMMFEQRCAFLIYRTKVTYIQRKYRAIIHMRKERAAFELLKTSTICIQRRFRSNLLASIQRSQYLTFKQVTIFIQRRFRANKEMKMQRNYYLLQKKSCCVLQNHFRASALMKTERSFYSKLREAVLVIQRRYRANQSMKMEVTQYEMLKCNVVKIQRKFRATLSMRQSRREYLLMVQSIVFIQRKFRTNQLMIDVRQKYLTLRNNVILIQRKFRLTVLARNIRQEFNSLRSAAITIQCRYRATILAKRQRLEYLRTRKAVLIIQHRYIGYKSMQCERTRYQQMREAAIIIQTKFRANLVMKKQRSSFLQLKNAVTQIQTRYRSNVLMRTQRTEYLKLRCSAVIIQNWFRATMMMKKLSNQYKLIRCLVVCIQQKFRAKVAMQIERKKFLELRSTVVLLQQKYRANKQMLIDQSNLQRTKSTVAGLQARIRGYLARQAFLKRMTPEVLLKIKQNKCAKKIQAHWRGWIVRKKNNAKAVALKKIRANIQRITRNVKPEKSIRNVLVNHVAQLKKTYNVNETLNVLYALVRISRVVPYTLIDDSVFVANFCYGIMSQAIRSEMDKLVIEQCSYIILNMARYELTKQNAFQRQGLTTVSQMLLRWCDKDCNIFDTLCTVIYVFAHCPEMLQDIRCFMTSSDAVFTLNEIKRLVIRKEIMRKNKMIHLSKTPLTARQKIQLPMLKPDFGMKSNKPSNTPYIFNCSVFGFDTILNKLGIEK